MKTGIDLTKRFFIISSLAVSSIFAMTACSKDNDDDNKVMFNLGVNATLVQDVNITTVGATGASTGSITLTDQQETDLLGGNWYYLIGTSNNLTGEVRGQITASPQ